MKTAKSKPVYAGIDNEAGQNAADHFTGINAVCKSADKKFICKRKADGHSHHTFCPMGNDRQSKTHALLQQF